MRNIILCFLLIFPSAFWSFSQTAKTEVIICSTLHGLHKKNTNYNYDSLYSFIERYNPDVIGVEIRPEDMDSSVNYLKRNYPFEMYNCITKYSDKIVLGIDWLGNDIEGKAIAPNYWKEISPVKLTQQQLNQDSLINEKLAVLGIVSEEKYTIAKESNIHVLNDGRYDVLNTVYYKQLAELLKNTPYESISGFYTNRDEKIASNIIKIIKNNPGKRILFLVGADHRSYSMNATRNEFKTSIILKNP